MEKIDAVPMSRKERRKQREGKKSKLQLLLPLLAIPSLVVGTLFTAGTMANWNDAESAGSQFQAGVHGLQANNGNGTWTTSNSTGTVALNFNGQGGTGFWAPNQTRVATLELRGDQNARAVPFSILNMQAADITATGTNNIINHYSWEWHHIPSGTCSVNLKGATASLLARGNASGTGTVRTVSSANSTSLSNVFTANPRATARTCIVLTSGANIPQASDMNISWNIHSRSN